MLTHTHAWRALSADRLAGSGGDLSHVGRRTRQADDNQR
jgi:hypothetical protein